MYRSKSTPNLKFIRTPETQTQQEITRLKEELNGILQEIEHMNRPIRTPPQKETPTIAQVLRRILFLRDVRYLLSL